MAQHDGFRIISHTGATYGYSAHSIHIPEKKLYIFYANYYFGDPNSLPKRIVSRLLNLPYPKAVPLTNAKLTDYVGAFQLHHPGSRMAIQISDRPVYATFTTSGDSLFIRFTEREKSYLRPTGKDEFTSRTGDPVYTFYRDAKGNVVSVGIKPLFFGGAYNEKAKKVAVPTMPAAKIVVVKPEILRKYAGTYYKTNGDDYFFVAAQDGKLYGFEMDIAQKFELLPVAENKFIRKGVEDVSYSFMPNVNGIMALTISGNRKLDYRKVSD